jgi:hypothetical protein
MELPDCAIETAGAATPHACFFCGAASSGLVRRDLLVLDTCLGAGVAVAGYVGGGYDRDLDVLAERHMVLHKAALQMWKEHEL